MGNSPNAKPELALSDLGLKKGNPFATFAAEQERDFLGQVFVDGEPYDQIKENHTQIIYAPRGGGKSFLFALRANEMAPIQSQSNAFAVELTDFDRFYGLLAEGKGPRAQDYVDEILRLGAQAVVNFRFEKGSALKRLQKFTPPDRSRLAKLLWTFSSDTFSPETLYERIVQLAGFEPDWDDLCDAVQNGSLRALLGKTMGEGNALAAALAFFFETRVLNRSWLPVSLKEQLDILYKLVHALDDQYQTLVILIDRVDEIPETSDHPEIQADLLCPLLAHLQLMEAPHICYKLFIPASTHDELIKRPEIRTDRLVKMELTVEWSEVRLRRILERRLKNLGGITELGEICGSWPAGRPPGEKGVGEAITLEMIGLAKGSPRRLIRAGQLLLDAFILRPGRKPGDKILYEDWLKAREKLDEEPPGVTIPAPPPAEVQQPLPELQPSFAVDADGTPLMIVYEDHPNVQIAGTTIRLTPVEFSILQSLTLHKGYCAVEIMVDEVWENGITTGGVDQALNRLRKKIGTSLGKENPGKDNTYLEKDSEYIWLYHYQFVKNQ